MISLLYICNEDRGTTRQRLLALSDLKVDVEVIYTSRLQEPFSIFKRLYRALLFRFGFFPERNNENSKIRRAAGQRHFDVVFVEKGLSIRPSTLRFIKAAQKNATILSYTLDDVIYKYNSSVFYRKSLPLYDFHFTNKKFNVAELAHLGARNVNYFKNAFSTHVHRPVFVQPNERAYYGSDIGFIGTYEQERVMLIRFLAEEGYQVKVWGWGRSGIRSGLSHPNISVMDRHVYDDEYAKVVCSTRINLCFLRKINRDQETTRSMELPACGGFMLAERTPEHQSLFEEGIEAEYFSDKHELLEKVRHYLANDEARLRIAAAGRRRCLESGYSYHEQLRKILNHTLGYEAIGDCNYAPHTV